LTRSCFSFLIFLKVKILPYFLNNIHRYRYRNFCFITILIIHPLYALISYIGQ